MMVLPFQAQLQLEAFLDRIWDNLKWASVFILDQSLNNFAELYAVFFGIQAALNACFPIFFKFYPDGG